MESAPVAPYLACCPPLQTFVFFCYELATKIADFVKNFFTSIYYILTEEKNLTSVDVQALDEELAKANALVRQIELMGNTLLHPQEEEKMSDELEDVTLTPFQAATIQATPIIAESLFNYETKDAFRSYFSGLLTSFFQEQAEALSHLLIPTNWDSLQPSSRKFLDALFNYLAVVVPEVNIFLTQALEGLVSTEEIPDLVNVIREEISIKNLEQHLSFQVLKKFIPKLLVRLLPSRIQTEVFGQRFYSALYENIGTIFDLPLGAKSGAVTNLAHFLFSLFAEFGAKKMEQLVGRVAIGPLLDQMVWDANFHVQGIIQAILAEKEVAEGKHLEKEQAYFAAFAKHKSCHPLVREKICATDGLDQEYPGTTPRFGASFFDELATMITEKIFTQAEIYEITTNLFAKKELLLEVVSDNKLFISFCEAFLNYQDQSQHIVASVISVMKPNISQIVSSILSDVFLEKIYKKEAIYGIIFDYILPSFLRSIEKGLLSSILESKIKQNPSYYLFAFMELVREKMVEGDTNDKKRQIAKQLQHDYEVVSHEQKTAFGHFHYLEETTLLFVDQIEQYLLEYLKKEGVAFESICTEQDILEAMQVFYQEEEVGPLLDQYGQLMLNAFLGLTDTGYDLITERIRTNRSYTDTFSTVFLKMVRNVRKEHGTVFIDSLTSFLRSIKTHEDLSSFFEKVRVMDEVDLKRRIRQAGRDITPRLFDYLYYTGDNSFKFFLFTVKKTVALAKQVEIFLTKLFEKDEMNYSLGFKWFKEIIGAMFA